MIACCVPFFIGSFGICYCWGPTQGVNAVHGLVGSTTAADGTCHHVSNVTSQCVLRGREKVGDREWCEGLTAPSITASSLGSSETTGKWVATLGPNAKQRLYQQGWCNHDTAWGDSTDLSKENTIPSDCLCCAPPKPRCLDSKLRLSTPQQSFVKPPIKSRKAASADAQYANLQLQNFRRQGDRNDFRVCTFIGSAPDGMNGGKKFSDRRNAIADTWADENTYVLWPREIPYVQDREKRLTPFYLDIPKDLKYSEVTHRYFRLVEMLNVDSSSHGTLSSCDFALIVDDDAYINLEAWKDYFSSGWLNPDDIWYMGPFSSTRIDRGMMPFAHGTTIVVSKGLIREAANWLPLCYIYFDNPEGVVDYWGDVRRTQCFASHVLYYIYCCIL